MYFIFLLAKYIAVIIHTNLINTFKRTIDYCFITATVLLINVLKHSNIPLKWLSTVVIHPFFKCWIESQVKDAVKILSSCQKTINTYAKQYSIVFNSLLECIQILYSKGEYTCFVDLLKWMYRNQTPHGIFLDSLFIGPIYRFLLDARSRNLTSSQTDYLQRLATYNSFPSSSPLQPSHLARAGFHYTREGDKVQCSCCGLECHGWTDGDDPLSVHKSLSPLCPFFLGMPPEIRLNTRSLIRTQHDSAVYPEYSGLKDRLRTFQNWNRPNRIDEFVHLGFFYAGYSDCVRCFYCGIGLKSWEPDDDIAFEHARWRPNCQYLRLVKGDEFVDNVSRGEIVRGSLENSLHQQLISGTATYRPRNGDPNPNSNGTATHRPRNGDPYHNLIYNGTATYRPRNSDPYINLISNGNATYRNGDPYLNLISNGTATYRPRNGDPYPNSNPFTGAVSVSATVSELNQYITRLEAAEESSAPGEFVATRQSNQLSLHQQNAAPRPDHIAGLNYSVAALDVQLSQKMKCCICQQNVIGVVFYPCCHAVSCLVCAQHLMWCPSCSEVVQSTVKFSFN